MKIVPGCISSFSFAKEPSPDVESKWSKSIYRRNRWIHALEHTKYRAPSLMLIFALDLKMSKSSLRCCKRDSLCPCILENVI